MQSENLPEIAAFFYDLGNPEAIAAFLAEDSEASLEYPWLGECVAVDPPADVDAGDEILIVRCPDGSVAVQIWDGFCEAERGFARGEPGCDIRTVVVSALVAGGADV